MHVKLAGKKLAGALAYKIGALPLAVLERKVDAWIAAKKD